MPQFHIRAEVQGGQCKDHVVGAGTLAAARDLFEIRNAALGPFDWRGAVVFCQSTKPVEERIGAPAPLAIGR